MLYKEQVNAKTGAKRWVAVQGPQQNSADKLKNIPLIGNTLSNLSSIAKGAVGEKLTTGLSDMASGAQKKSYDLAKQAQQTTDPTLKKQLLDESRRISQTTGEAMSKYTGNITGGIATFGDNKEPTNPLESIKTYGPSSVRSGAEVGMLLAPGTSGIKTAATKPIGQILTAGAAGGTTSGIAGLAEGDDKTILERLKKGGTDAIIGTLVSAGLAAAGQGVKAVMGNKTKIATSVANKTSDTADKLNVFKKVSNKATKLAETSKNKISQDTFQTNMLKEAENLTGQDKINFLKRLAKEPAGGEWNVLDALNIKRKVPFSATSKTSEKVFNNVKKRVLGNLLHEVEPQLADLDAIYELGKKSSKPVSKWLSNLIKLAVAGGAFGTGAGLINTSRQK